MVGTLWVMLGALGLVAVANVTTGQAWPSMTTAALATVHGLSATALPLVAIYAALARIRLDDVATLGPLEPIVASGVAVLALGESLTAAQSLGITVVVAAVAHMSGAIRLGRAGRPARPRVGLPRLPFLIAKDDGAGAASTSRCGDQPGRCGAPVGARAVLTHPRLSSARDGPAS